MSIVLCVRWLVVAGVMPTVQCNPSPPMIRGIRVTIYPISQGRQCQCTCAARACEAAAGGGPAAASAPPPAGLRDPRPSPSSPCPRAGDRVRPAAETTPPPPPPPALAGRGPRPAPRPAPRPTPSPAARVDAVGVSLLLSSDRHQLHSPRHDLQQVLCRQRRLHQPREQVKRQAPSMQGAAGAAHYMACSPRLAGAAAVLLAARAVARSNGRAAGAGLPPPPVVAAATACARALPAAAAAMSPRLVGCGGSAGERPTCGVAPAEGA